MTLFRKEVIDYKRGKYFGEMSLIVPVRYVQITSVLLFVFISMAIFVSFVEVPQITKVSGEVAVEGEQVLFNPLTGAIQKIHVNLGQEVAQGQLLVEIEKRDYSADGLSIKESLLSAINEEEVSLKETYLLEEEKILIRQRDLSLEIGKLESQVELFNQSILNLNKKLNDEKSLYDVYSDVFEIGGVSKKKLNSLRIDVEETELQIKDYRLKLSQKYSTLEQVKLDIEASKLEKAELEQKLKDGLMSTSQRRRNLQLESKIEILSPISGIVANIFLPEGAELNLSVPVISIIPTDTRFIGLASLENNKEGQISLGLRATIKIDAFPSRKYGHVIAKVNKISTSPVTSSNGQKSFNFQLEFEPDMNSQIILKPGLSFNADIVTDTVPIFDWLFFKNEVR